MPYSQYGLPDFAKGSVFDDYCMKCGFYGFVWWKLPDIKKAVDEYLGQLKNPLLWYAGIGEDECQLQEWKDRVSQTSKPGVNAEAVFNSASRLCSEWTDANGPVLSALESIQGLLLEYYDMKQKTSPYCDLIDVDETVFLLFFDN